MKKKFKAKIYKTGINWCVDVPLEVSKDMPVENGYIRIKGQINDYDFSKSLVPVKNGPYRLFVNGIMMKGGKTALGEFAEFSIEPDQRKELEADYPVPPVLTEKLIEHQLLEDFNALSPYRRKEILKYLNTVKTEDTFQKNMAKLIHQLQVKVKTVRVP